MLALGHHWLRKDVSSDMLDLAKASASSLGQNFSIKSCLRWCGTPRIRSTSQVPHKTNMFLNSQAFKALNFGSFCSLINMFDAVADGYEKQCAVWDLLHILLAWIPPNMLELMYSVLLGLFGSCVVGGVRFLGDDCDLTDWSSARVLTNS